MPDRSSTPCPERRPRRPWRRAALLTATLAGCWSATGGDEGAQAGSCDLPPLGLNFGPSSAFTFQCPAGPNDEALDLGSDAGSGAADASAAEGAFLRSFITAAGDRSNLGCLLPFFTSYSNAWHVAVGAPFGLQLQEPHDGGTITTLIAEPVVPSIAEATARGWVMPAPGYLGFVASTDAGVVDSTDVVASPLTSLNYISQSVGGPVQGLWIDDASPPPAIEATVGDEVDIVVVPEGAEGALAGSIECTFASSDPSRLAIQGDGLVGIASPLGAGEVTMTATCAGVAVQATVMIAGTGDAGDDASDAAAGDASDDGGADGDAADARDTPGPGDGGPSDAPNDSAFAGGG
jgi:hypothetical protein